MAKALLFIIAIIYWLPNYSQELSGKVLNSENNEPIVYASIGIINKPYGTYSDENGHFKLSLKDYSEVDSIRVSCIGYKTVCYGIHDFIEYFKNGQNNISLEELVTSIKEITILGNGYKTETIGNTWSTQQLLIGFFGEREKGIIIKNDKKLFLKEVAFKLTMAGGRVPDSAVFRFNIYNLKNDLPYENILTEPIYFHLNEDQFYGTNEFDLSKYNISVDGDFAATFELIKQYRGSRIYFASWFSGNQSVWRIGNQGSWQNIVTDKNAKKMYQSLKLKVSYEKKGKSKQGILH